MYETCCTCLRTWTPTVCCNLQRSTVWKTNLKVELLRGEWSKEAKRKLFPIYVALINNFNEMINYRGISISTLLRCQLHSYRCHHPPTCWMDPSFQRYFQYRPFSVCRQCTVQYCIYFGMFYTFTIHNKSIAYPITHSLSHTPQITQGSDATSASHRPDSVSLC